MSTSYTKKLKNEMENLEFQSDKFIPSEKYYIIKIHIFAEYDIIKNLGKIFLARNPQHTPLTSYVFQNELCLIFSRMQEDQSHYLNGSQQKIISEYISYVSTEVQSSNCHANIIEFESQTQVVFYLMWKVYTNFQLCAYEISNKNISMEDINSFTQTELIEKLENIGINWEEDISNERKYGIFLKLKKDKNSYVISTLSEYIDARNSKKYVNYIFGEVS
jgi:hypothetical protein